MAGCKPTVVVPVSGKIADWLRAILPRALAKLSYWSRGITVCKPSFPPCSCINTNTLSVWVCSWLKPAKAGVCANACTLSPFISEGIKTAGTRVLIKFLRFISKNYSLSQDLKSYLLYSMQVHWEMDSDLMQD